MSYKSCEHHATPITFHHTGMCVCVCARACVTTKAKGRPHQEKGEAAFGMARGGSQSLLVVVSRLTQQYGQQQQVSCYSKSVSNGGMVEKW